MPTTFEPTAEQAIAVDLFATGQDLAIEAGAGAGKTSTLVLLAEHALAEGRTGIYLAFNKALVVEADAKLPGNVNASTAHSLAFRAYGYKFKKRLNSPRIKSGDIARILGISAVTVRYGKEEKYLAAGYLAGLTLRAVENFCSSADKIPTTRHIPYVDGIDLPGNFGERGYANNDIVRNHLIGAVREAWVDLSQVEGKLPYKHSHYLKGYELSGPTVSADFILFDEAQDVSPVLLSIVQQQTHAQKVYVGDSAQAIYEFTGAVDALSRIIERGAARATLSQSFRFGDAVATVANGLLSRIGSDLKLSGFGPVSSVVGPVDEPDCVLTRTNAEAVRRFLAALWRKQQPFLVGGGEEVIKFAKAALDLQGPKHWTSHPELSCFKSWDEVIDYVANDEQGSDLRLLVKLITEFGAETIIESLSNQPREEDADIIISTAHKAKGREWGSVALAGDFAEPKDGKDDVPVAELRLLYVACTRAKRELDISAIPHVNALGLRPSHPEATDNDYEEEEGV